MHWPGDRQRGSIAGHPDPRDVPRRLLDHIRVQGRARAALAHLGREGLGALPRASRHRQVTVFSPVFNEVPGSGSGSRREKDDPQQ